MRARCKALLEQRAAVEAKIDDLLNQHEEAGTWDAETQQTYDSLVDESTQLKAHADRLQRQDDVHDELNEVKDEARDAGVAVPEEEIVNTAILGWFIANTESIQDEVTNEHRAAAERCGIAFDKQLALPLMRVSQAKAAFQQMIRGQSAQIGTEGGYLVSETMIGAFEVALLAYGGVLQVADIIRTTQSNPMAWPTFDDTGNKGRRIGEQKKVKDAPGLKLGKRVWNAFKYTTDVLKVPYETLRDVPELPRLIGEAFGERMGRITNEEMTLGDGGSMPQGIVPGSTDSGFTPANNALTFDDLIDLEHSIDPALRNQGAAWMCNDGTVKVLRKIKDGDGHYIWQRSVTAGVPDTLFNYPVRLNHDMAGVGASNISMLFGLLNKYKVRQVGQLRSYRLTELYREEDADGFVSFTEADGGILDPTNGGAGAPIKHLKHAA